MALGGDIQYFLSLHAFLGCDTTSDIFRIGKGKAIEVFIKNDNFRKLMATFANRNAVKDVISRAGEDALLLCYPIKKRLDTPN